MLSIIIPVKDPELYLPILLHNIYSMIMFPYEVIVQKEIGLTNAIVEGVKKAEYSCILVMDADGSHDPHIIPMMYGLSRKFDALVVAYKEKDDSSLFRRVISLIYRDFAKLMLGIRIKDPMSGFVLGPKELFQKIKPSNDYKFLLQMLVLKPNVKEVGFHFCERKTGKSKATLKTGLRTLWSICVLRYHQHTF